VIPRRDRRPQRPSARPTDARQLDPGHRGAVAPFIGDLSTVLAVHPLAPSGRPLNDRQPETAAAACALNRLRSIVQDHHRCTLNVRCPMSRGHGITESSCHYPCIEAGFLHAPNRRNVFFHSAKE
jgi:hypothetical protein